MGGLLTLSRCIDAVTAFIGRRVIWLILAAILVSAANAIIRKAFDMSSNAWLELQWYLFGCVFMVASAYTLQKNEHIRIDIIFSRLSPQARNWIDVFGHVLMLLPFTALMIYESVPFAWSAWRSGEMSGSAGGLIIWPARAFILAGFFLLFLQGLSELIKRIAVMQGLIPEPYPQHEPHAPLEPQ
jgi:TRAP-type mannitol/chloroaromatic compound transport system permease small subunit